MTAIPSLRWQRQKDLKFKACLDYPAILVHTPRPCFKYNDKREQMQKEFYFSLCTQISPFPVLAQKAELSHTLTTYCFLQLLQATLTLLGFTNVPKHHRKLISHYHLKLHSLNIVFHFREVGED